MWEQIKALQRQDGVAQVTFRTSADGLFSFSEDNLKHEEHPMGEIYSYWLPVYESGLYRSLEDAEADARATIPWLRGSRI